MAFCYLNHRPRFFKQKALVITTSAGAGTNKCNRYISQNLSFWGINKVYTFGQAMQAADWSEVPYNIMAKLSGRLKRIAQLFGNDIKSKKLYSPSLIQTIMFHMSKLLMNSYQINADKVYWLEQGWLKPQSNYFSRDLKPGYFHILVAKLVTFILRKAAKIKPQH
jgi:hypothetical protein